MKYSFQIWYDKPQHKANVRIIEHGKKSTLYIVTTLRCHTTCEVRFDQPNCPNMIVAGDCNHVLIEDDRVELFLNNTPIDELMVKLQSIYPEMVMRTSEDRERILLTSESAGVDNWGLPLLDKNTKDKHRYLMGVRKPLIRMLGAEGWFARWDSNIDLILIKSS